MQNQLQLNNLGSLLDSNSPIESIEKLGRVLEKSKMLDLEINQGAMVVLTCVTEGITLLDFKRKYHIVQNKLSMRTDYMLADLMAKGGKYKWVDTGENGKASIEIEYKGNKGISTFTIEDAKRAGVVRSGGVWQKYPDAMLRARAVSKGCRIYAPEIVAGFYNEEETESFSAPSNYQQTKFKPVEIPDVKIVDEVDYKKKLSEKLGDDKDGFVKFLKSRKSLSENQNFDDLTKEQCKVILNRYSAYNKKYTEFLNDKTTAEQKGDFQDG